MKAHEFVIAMIGVCTLLLIGLLLIPKRSDSLARPDAKTQILQPKDPALTSQNGLYIKTIKHDGHMFVSAQTGSSYGAASIIHHPDCQCLKPKER